MQGLSAKVYIYCLNGYMYIIYNIIFDVVLSEKLLNKALNLYGG